MVHRDWYEYELMLQWKQSSSLDVLLSNTNHDSWPAVELHSAVLTLSFYMRILAYHISALADYTLVTVVLRRTAKSSIEAIFSSWRERSLKKTKENLATYRIFYEKQLVENERMTAGLWFL